METIDLNRIKEVLADKKRTNKWLADVVVYTKLPRGFYINTPMGKYYPDWAIVLKEGEVKHIYFVAETKGSLDSGQLRGTEAAKIKCARQHFQTISTGDIKYDVVTSYSELMDAVMN